MRPGDLNGMAVINVILPVCLIFAAGFLLQKKFHLEIRSISATALYLMLPALMFKTFYQTELNQTFYKIIVYVILLSVLIIWLIKGIGFIKRYDSKMISALILSTAFMNNGNFGAPVILFAFGEKGFQYAVVILTMHTVMISTFGIYYAAKGKMDIKGSLLSVIKIPMIWGSVAGILMSYFDVPVPENLNGAIELVADAAVPTIMLTLGMQLAEIKLSRLQWGKISLAVFVRLILSPIIAWGIVSFLQVDPLLERVMIISAAMPAAAITTMYALQYDSEPDLVSAITLISTLLSIGTLSILLALFL